jgi:hypothetical protein
MGYYRDDIGPPPPHQFSGPPPPLRRDGKDSIHQHGGLHCQSNYLMVLPSPLLHL